MPSCVVYSTTSLHLNNVPQTKQADVVFSEDRELVSYVTLSQSDFQPSLSNGTLKFVVYCAVILFPYVGIIPSNPRPVSMNT